MEDGRRGVRLMTLGQTDAIPCDKSGNRGMSKPDAMSSICTMMQPLSGTASTSKPLFGLSQAGARAQPLLPFPGSTQDLRAGRADAESPLKQRI